MKGYKDLVELLKHTQATGGLDIDEASICDYQDMIGHSSIEELKGLANSNYKESFYRVYGYSYGTVEAIRFFCKNSEKIETLYAQKADAEADAEEARVLLKQKQEEADRNMEQAMKMRTAWEEEHTDNASLKERIAEQEAEIMKLKAKLYDMIQAGA